MKWTSSFIYDLLFRKEDRNIKLLEFISSINTLYLYSIFLCPECSLVQFVSEFRVEDGIKGQKYPLS